MYGSVFSLKHDFILVMLLLCRGLTLQALLSVLLVIMEANTMNPDQAAQSSFGAA